MLKMARDRLRRFAKEAKAGTPPPPAEEEEARLCGALAKALGAAKGDKAAEVRIFEQEWRGVYALAEAIMERTMKQVREQ